MCALMGVCAGAVVFVCESKIVTPAAVQQQVWVWACVVVCVYVGGCGFIEVDLCYHMLLCVRLSGVHTASPQPKL